MRDNLSLRRIPVFAIPITGAMLMLPASAAMAQVIPPDVAAIYDKSHTVKTNISGVTTFPAAPAGYNPLKNTAEQNAAYGVPPAPPTTDPSYPKWVKAAPLFASGKRLTGLKASNLKSTNMKAVVTPGAGLEGAPTKTTSFNWSGIANTVPKLTVWNSKKSVEVVYSTFNVPFAQQAFGACDGHDDIAVSWNGIDGFNNGTVLQGGSLSDAFCDGGGPVSSYVGWIEWYPSYPIIPIPAPVFAGDDFFVETYDTSATNGYVCVSDLTQGWAGCFNLIPLTGPALVGNSAEYIVERPFGAPTSSGYFPLMNYLEDFWADSYAYPFTGAQLYPASTASSTYLITMFDDSGAIPISSVAEIGSKYQMLFENENCSQSIGCATTFTDGGANKAAAK
jgi:Peptidase A4 family